MIKAVIFDLDNTLLDFMSVKRKAVDAAILAMKKAVDTATQCPQAGLEYYKSHLEKLLNTRK